MAKVLMTCSCGTPCLAEVGQSSINGRLSWYSSFICPSCGRATEIDGYEYIPSEIRESILKQEGQWGLEIRNETKISLMLKILRKELNLSLKDAIELRDLIPGIVLTGTRIEIQRLKQILDENEISSDISEII